MELSDTKDLRDSPLHADIVVVGAGVIGITSALALRREGWSVILVDRQDPGMGASYGNAGHMATEQVYPIANASILTKLPKMLLDPMGPLRLDWKYLPKAMPWFSRLLWNMRRTSYGASAAGIRALNEASLNAWRRLLDSVEARHLLKENGSLLVFEKEESFSEVQILQKTLASQDVSSELWHGDDVRAEAPQLSSIIQGGLFFPDTAHVVTPYKVVETLYEEAKRQGVKFCKAEVVSGSVNDAGVSLSTTQSQSICCRKTVIACGAHSRHLTHELTGVKVPLDTERGYHLLLPNENDRLPLSVTSFERSFIMNQMDDGLRLAGTVEFAGLDRPPNMQRAWQLLKLSHELFSSELNHQDAVPWMGFRPTLPDSLPIIDHTMGGKVMLAFGHHHLGLTQAAVTAELVVDLAKQQDASPTPGKQSKLNIDMAPYRLSRFS